MHARFAEPGSDFLAFSRCGTTCASSSARCRRPRSAGCAGASILHYLRVREWQDVYGQLRQAAATSAW